MAQSTVRFLPLGGDWETLGAGRYKGVAAQAVEASSNEWGPDQLSFTLQTQAGQPRPDLLPYTPVELEVDGILCWSGRVKAKPASERDIAVQCEGWQYHLDDQVYRRMYVHQHMSDGWSDIRDGVNATDSTFSSAYTITPQFGMRLALPIAATTGAATRGVLVFDAGPDDTVARFSITYKGGGGANLSLNYETSTNFDGAGDGAVDIDTQPIATGATTTSITPPNTRRYLRVGVQAVGALTGISTTWARIQNIIVYRDAGYESGDTSALVASTVVADALTFAPLLNQSVGSVTAGTFVMPEFYTGGFVTPRWVMEAVNAYENYDLKIGGADLKTLIYRAKPTAPLFEVGQRAGAHFSDDGASGEDIFDSVVVQGTDNAGRTVEVTRTQTGTLVDRRGFSRSSALEIRSALTTAVANQLGDLWLADHRTVPLSGKLTGTGAFVRQVIGGASGPPAALLLHCGELIRLSHRREPDTGAQGRDGRIVGVSYKPATDELSLDIDDRRTSFDTVLARRETR